MCFFFFFWIIYYFQYCWLTLFFIRCLRSVREIDFICIIIINWPCDLLDGWDQLMDFFSSCYRLHLWRCFFFWFRCSYPIQLISVRAPDIRLELRRNSRIWRSEAKEWWWFSCLLHPHWQWVILGLVVPLLAVLLRPQIECQAGMLRRSWWGSM